MLQGSKMTHSLKLNCIFGSTLSSPLYWKRLGLSPKLPVDPRQDLPFAKLLVGYLAILEPNEWHEWDLHQFNLDFVQRLADRTLNPDQALGWPKTLSFGEIALWEEAIEYWKSQFATKSQENIGIRYQLLVHLAQLPTQGPSFAFFLSRPKDLPHTAITLLLALIKQLEDQEHLQQKLPSAKAIARHSHALFAEFDPQISNHLSHENEIYLLLRVLKKDGCVFEVPHGVVGKTQYGVTLLGKIIVKPINQSIKSLFIHSNFTQHTESKKEIRGNPP
jgi:hypothetical protein